MIADNSGSATGLLAVIWQILLRGNEAFRPDADHLSVVSLVAYRDLSLTVRIGAVVVAGLTAVLVIGFW